MFQAGDLLLPHPALFRELGHVDQPATLGKHLGDAVGPGQDDLRLALLEAAAVHHVRRVVLDPAFVAAMAEDRGNGRHVAADGRVEDAVLRPGADDLLQERVVDLVDVLAVEPRANDRSGSERSGRRSSA
jgi:hypothetical protein